MAEVFSATYGWTIAEVVNCTIPQIRLYIRNMYQRHASGFGLMMSPMGKLLQMWNERNSTTGTSAVDPRDSHALRVDQEVTVKGQRKKEVIRPTVLTESAASGFGIARKA